MKLQEGSARWPVTLAASFCAVLLFAGASIAVAALTFSGTTISGDSGVVIDSSSTISIGASSSTGITIGRSGITATFPGTVTITGTTTTLQNLVVSGSCIGCGIGNFTAGGDLSGSSTSQTVIGIQGRAVSSTAPSTNQVLSWNGSFWTPANVSNTGTGITAINGLSNATTSIVGVGTVTVSTSSPNIITITGTGSGAITINSFTTSTFQIQGSTNQIIVATSSPNIISLSLPQSIGTTSIPTFGGLALNGNATTTTLTISGLASSGSPCLSISATGAIATTTCASGAGSPGGSTTEIQVNNAGRFGGYSNFTYDGAHLSVSSGTINAGGLGYAYLYGGQPFIYASSTLSSMYIGLNAGTVSASGTGNTIVGYQAGHSVTVPGLDPGSTTPSQADTFFGYNAGGSLTTARESTLIGFSAGADLTGTGAGTEDGINTCIGSESCALATTAYGNVAVGQKAGAGIVTSQDNVNVGTHDGNSMTGNDNVMMGAGVADTGGVGTLAGNSNVFIGYQVANTSGTINSNVMIGSGAGDFADSSSDNLYLGDDAGEYDASGSNNVFLGEGAGNNNQGSNNIIIGQNVLIASTTANNQMNIGNTIFGNLSNGWISIGTSTVSQTLLVNGSTQLTGGLTLPGSGGTINGSGGSIGMNSGIWTFGSGSRIVVSAPQVGADPIAITGAVTGGSNIAPLFINSTLAPNGAGQTTNGITDFVTNSSAGIANTVNALSTTVTDSSTSTNTDVGISSNVSGGTNASATRYSGLFIGGNFGIGTTAPSTTLQVAGASSTIRIGAGSVAGCLELMDSSGNGVINYLTATGGVLSATTTKPSNCQ